MIQKNELSKIILKLTKTILQKFSIFRFNLFKVKIRFRIHTRFK